MFPQLFRVLPNFHECFYNSIETRSTCILKSKDSEKEFSEPPKEIEPMTFKYRLDALTTELWETRGEQGHILGSYMGDMCPAILQG